MGKKLEILGFTLWESKSKPINPQPGDVFVVEAKKHYPLLGETKSIRVRVPIGEPKQ